MSSLEANRYTPTGTIAAGGTSVVTLDPKGAAFIGLVIKNTGSNTITAVTVEKSPLGNLYGTDTALGTAIGTITAGSTSLTQISTSGFESIKITLGSTSGSTYSIEGKAVH